MNMSAVMKYKQLMKKAPKSEFFGETRYKMGIN